MIFAFIASNRSEHCVSRIFDYKLHCVKFSALKMYCRKIMYIHRCVHLFNGDVDFRCLTAYCESKNSFSKMLAKSENECAHGNEGHLMDDVESEGCTWK